MAIQTTSVQVKALSAATAALLETAVNSYLTTNFGGSGVPGATNTFKGVQKLTFLYDADATLYVCMIEYMAQIAAS